MRADEALLLDMWIAAHKILSFAQGLDEESFAEHLMAQSAIIREIQVIGEAARLISDETKASSPGIPWRALVGMRHRLVHEYFSIDLPILWATVQQDIPQLLAQLQTMLPPPNPPQK